MVREELVASAVSFLRDPTVAAAAIDKRVAFLLSKNLSQEEIDTALARANDGPQNFNTPHSPQQSQHGYQGQSMGQQVNYGYSNGPYHGVPWIQALSEPARRDWRDWFIMATVTGGVGYGLIAFARRYIMPLIDPPTPPQLEADKASIDASFNRAFALIDQLTIDTTRLQISETERTEKLDASLEGIDSVVDGLKAANSRHEAESKVVADQIQGLKDLVPKALQGWKASGDARIEELGQEVQSLKKLLENRVGRSASSSTLLARGFPPATVKGNEKSKENFSTLPPASSSTMSPIKESAGVPAAPAPGITAPKQDSQTPSDDNARGDKRATIPAWQMAAADKRGVASSDRNGNGSNPEAGA